MRKLKIYMTAALAALVLCTGGFAPSGIVSEAAGAEYYIGGMTAGFTLSAGGTEIIGLNEVVAEDGTYRPATDAGLRVGDCICAVDGICVKSISDLNAAMERSGGKTVDMKDIPDIDTFVGKE